MFYLLCKDLYPTVFSFLLYTESISLQKCSKYSLQQKEKMDKYCQHIQPHGILETYDRETKLIITKDNYKEGTKEGIQKLWRDKGVYYYELTFKKGIQEGIQKGWIDEQLWYEHNYKKGKKDGMQHLWGPAGYHSLSVYKYGIKLYTNYFTKYKK